MKPLSRLIFCLFCGCLLSPAFAQAQGQTNIVLKGETVDAAGKHIALYRYNDVLTQNEVLVDETDIDDSRTFELKAYANYPQLMCLKIENYSQSFYVEPGRTYNIYLPRFDWNLDEKRNIHIAPEALPFEFYNLPPDELNLLILRYDNVFDSLMDAYSVHLDVRFRPNHKYFDTLEMELNRLVPDTKSEFFNRYKEYRLAEARLLMGFVSRKKVYEKYVDAKPILYYDENYMSLIYALYAESVSHGSRYVPLRRLVAWVANGDCATMLDSLGKDPLLLNEQVRELAAIQALSECAYNTELFNPSNVVDMLRKIASNTKFSQHKDLAGSVIQKVSGMKVGFAVPEIELPDVDKNLVNLKNLKGKWVYLSFVRVTDPNSQGEMETIAHFYDSIMSVSNSVAFVTIACDREFQKMYHFIKNTRKGGKYKWQWLHFDGNYPLLERLQVVSFPSFLLLNPDGKVQFSVTPSPATGYLLHGPWMPAQEDTRIPFFLDQYSQ